MASVCGAFAARLHLLLFTHRQIRSRLGVTVSGFPRRLPHYFAL
jgi:hypothetical protein